MTASLAGSGPADDGLLDSWPGNLAADARHAIRALPDVASAVFRAPAVQGDQGPRRSLSLLVQHLSLHVAAPVIALIGAVGFIALRLILKTVKVGLLLAAPALLYLLHQH